MLNRECPKCGDILGTVRHNRVLDQMQLECRLCKYEWTLKPLDVLRADREKQAAQGKCLHKNRVGEIQGMGNITHEQCVDCGAETTPGKRDE